VSRAFEAAYPTEPLPLDSFTQHVSQMLQCNTADVGLLFTHLDMHREGKVAIDELLRALTAMQVAFLPHVSSRRAAPPPPKLEAKQQREEQQAEVQLAVEPEAVPCSIAESPAPPPEMGATFSTAAPDADSRLGPSSASSTAQASVVSTTERRPQTVPSRPGAASAPLKLGGAPSAATAGWRPQGWAKVRDSVKEVPPEQLAAAVADPRPMTTPGQQGQSSSRRLAPLSGPPQKLLLEPGRRGSHDFMGEEASEHEVSGFEDQTGNLILGIGSAGSGATQGLRKHLGLASGSGARVLVAAPFRKRAPPQSLVPTGTAARPDSEVDLSFSALGWGSRPKSDESSLVRTAHGSEAQQTIQQVADSESTSGFHHLEFLSLSGAPAPLTSAVGRLKTMIPSRS